MAKVKVELNRSAVRELLLSDEMMNICHESAMQVQQIAGEGYEITKYTGKNRVNVSVIATSNEAIQDNLNNNTLLKAVGKGNG